MLLWKYALMLHDMVQEYCSVGIDCSALENYFLAQFGCGILSAFTQDRQEASLLVVYEPVGNE